MVQQIEITLKPKRRGFHLVTSEILSQSVLIEVAQFLLYSATLLGVDIAIDKIKELLRKKE